MRTKVETLLMVCIIISAACKTRKVSTDITQTSKTTVTAQQSQVHKADSASTIDKSASSKQSLTEAKDTSVTELDIDSIVTSNGKTIVYPKGPVKITKISSVKNQSTATRQNDIQTTAGKTVDSTGSFNQQVQQDSSHKTKVSDAKGSGTTWALWVPIVGGLVLIFGLFLLYKYLK